MQQIRSVGIIGLGSFGRFVPRLVPAGMAVLGYDNSPADRVDGITVAPFNDVAKCDIVVLAIPFAAYDQTLRKLRATLPSTSLLLDVCSVKVRPMQLMNRYFPEHPEMLCTHPLFGRLLFDSDEGRQLITTHVRGDRAKQALAYLHNNHAIDIISLSAEEHDRTMAYTHALPYFIGRAFAHAVPSQLRFSPPSFRLFQRFVVHVENNSESLFSSIEKDNPYASEVREAFMKILSETNDELERRVGNRPGHIGDDSE